MPHMQVDGRLVHFCDRGMGHPILFVHGFPLNHEMWRPELDALALDYRVIAPDLRGFGQSEGNGDATVTMEQFADDLVALLDSLQVDEPVTYCGLSMGGYIAWPFLRKYPERLNSLVLCDTRASADPPEAQQARYKLAEEVLENGPEVAARAMIPKLFAACTIEHRPEMVENVQQMILQTDPHAIAAASRGMAERPDMTASLADIDLPTLVIVGKEDRITPPEDMREMAHSINGAIVAEIPEAGHLAPLENPKAVNGTLCRFLKTLQ